MEADIESKADEVMLLTVAVAVYNVNEVLLRRCLDSLVLSGKDRGIEILLVDDGSTNGCEAVLDEYAERYEYMRAFHTENQGLSGARNVGLDNARGSWVMFVDGDDYVPSGFIDRVEDLLAKGKDADILFFGYKSTWDLTGTIEPCTGTDSISPAPSPFELSKSIVGNNEFQFGYENAVKFGTSWGKFFRRSFIENHGCRFTVGVNKSQDRVFMVELLSYKPRLLMTDTVGYVYVSNQESVTRAYNPNMESKLAHTYEVTEQRIRQYYQGQELKEMLDQLVQMRCVFMYDALDTTYLCPVGNPSYHHELKEFIEYVQPYLDCIDKVDLKLIYGVRNKFLVSCLKHRRYRIAYYGSMIMMDAYLRVHRHSS